MTADQTLQAALYQATAAPTAAAALGRPPAMSDHGGWTVQRREVINDAAGVCARCGMTGADTVVRGWADEQLIAAHTRCVVGLGPARSGPDRAA